MAFTSEVKVELERLENGDLKIKFNNENMQDLIIKRAGVPKEKIGAEARALLAASLAECLGSTALFLLNWANINLKKFQTTVNVLTDKDEKGRICVDTLNMKINIDIPKDEETTKKLKRVKRLLERGCLMSRSLKRGIKVNYEINT